MIEVEVTKRTLLYYQYCEKCKKPFVIGDKVYRTNRKGYFCTKCFQTVWRERSEK